MYKILHYNQIDTTGISSKFNKVVEYLSNGNFKSAEVKKLQPLQYYRAKLDKSNRLLFMPIKSGQQRYILLLEIIRNHNYERSRFLNGAVVQESQICEEVFNNDAREIQSVSEGKKVHLLDKLIMFDADQDQILQHPLPMIVIGSAGSGKTSVTLEKMKTLTGKILYVSLSSYLVSHTRKVYYAHNYHNDDQDIDFLSFEELLETIEIPQGKEITANIFTAWFARQNTGKTIRDSRKLFEEFRGVITGSEANVEYMDETDYLALGIKQSIYLVEARKAVYGLFKKYLSFLADNPYYDSNILASQYLTKVQSTYDAVVVDEVQDFTNSQLALVLATLAVKGQFLLCGDANQIVHPNFFSWSKLKSHFYQGNDLNTQSITRILTRNYRNAPEVTELANRVLKLKNYRFGSIDKESHYLVDSVSTSHGEANCLPMTSGVLKEVNGKTAKSIHYAIIVLHEKDKAEAAKIFDSPLIFTVQEAKGLEYENIILYNFIGSDSRYFEIAKGVDERYLTAGFDYARAKSKTDKSLETYKFYVNALYVAITRSIRNVYLIEKEPGHRFLKLLQVNEINAVVLDESKSSAEDWQKEASKLAQQGKDEQARAIEEKVLKNKVVPWQVLDQSGYTSLYDSVMSGEAPKKDRIRLLNYAMVYNDLSLIEKLKTMGVKAASNLSKCNTIMENDYFRDYAYRSHKQMMANVANYGLEFRNPFNMTPLMAATFTGSAEHVDKLIEYGASTNEVDNHNRNALMIAFHRCISNEKYRTNKFSDIYSSLVTDAISVEIDNKLVKIDQHKAEYFMLLFMYVTAQRNHLLDNSKLTGFTAVALCDFLSALPDKVIPAYRKKRSYISSILSKNEYQGNNKYNHHLFMRVKRGVYVLRDSMKIKWKR